MEPSCPKIKNFLIFSQKKVFLIFREMKLSSPKLKKLLIFQKRTFRPQKIKKNTLKKFLIFQEIELSSPKLKKLLYFF